MTNIDVDPSVVEVRPQLTGSGASARKFKIERRLETTLAQELMAVVAGLAVAVVLCGGLIWLAGSEIIPSYQALLKGAFGTENAVLETLVQATPLIFTGLAATFAFRAKVWNIGGEGQLFAGAMGAFLASDLLGDSLPKLPLLIVIFAFAASGGALWGGLAGVLRTRFGVNEIIATVMLNFVILNVVSFMLSDWWQDPLSFYYQTARMPDVAALPRLVAGSRLHLGFLIALFLAATVWFVLERTSFGYEVRSIGVNPRVAEYGGIRGAKVILLTMFISGALAGMGGASELAGVHMRLQLDISDNLGFTGIIIALVARLRPVGVIIAAIVAGALTNGATTMQLTTGVPAALVDVLRGLALVFVLIGAVAVNYRIRRVARDA